MTQAVAQIAGGVSPNARHLATTLMVALHPVTDGRKVGAAFIGIGVLLILYIAQLFLGGSRNPLKLIDGADGVWSTSKFQWFLWLIVILWAYTFLWVLRAFEGRYGAISHVPANLLTVLGFSTATAIGAKGITVGYLRSGQISKAGSNGGGHSSSKGNSRGGVLADDTGVPELAKIQMVGFTLVAIGIFFVTVLHQARGLHPSALLPNIDSSLLVLMGISQGGYIGKKLVTIMTPVIDHLSATHVKAGDPVKIFGSSFGSGGGSSRLLLDRNPIATTSWADTEIDFTVPETYPRGDGSWTYPQVIEIGVDLGGGTKGNEVTLVVDAPGK